MNTMLLVAFTLMLARYGVAVFLHEDSMIPIHPEVKENHTDFGFAMGFQTSKNSLVVGAPSVDVTGKVYTCDMGKVDVLKDISCQDNSINIKRSIKSRKDQHFFLGSTIAATSDKFLTCAPLKTIIYGGKETPIGDCYVYEEHGKMPYTYAGSYRQYLQHIRNGEQIMNDYFYTGGTGWTTFADEDNGLFIISKTSPQGDIVYTSTEIQKGKQAYQTNSLAVPLRRGIVSLVTNSAYNVGFGVTSGKFFSNSTVYAFSVTLKTMHGVIDFLAYNPAIKRLTLMNEEVNNAKFTIKSESIATMFGSVLAAADLDMDGFSDLLVAAPVYSDVDCVECGAVHIYLGGERATMTENLRIIGTKETGRFSTAIAARDVDGDGIPELVVSAPYEDEGLGAIYILPGKEVSNYIKKNKHKPFGPVMQLQPGELKHTQRIQSETCRTLGFSLQFVNDADANGCSELVAGSPGSGSAALFKGIQTINVTLSCALIGAEVVREQDKEFTMKVCAVVEYPKLPSIVNAYLTVTNRIIGEKAVLREPTIPFDISCTNCPAKQLYCKNVTVDLKDEQRRDYTFIAEAKLEADHILNSTEFNNTWVLINPYYSQLKKHREVARYCSGEDCKPKLTANLTWSGRIPYILGSSDEETVNILVRNDGQSSHGACVSVDVSGAPLSRVKNAALIDNIIYLRKPFARNTEQEITLVMDMSKPTNKHTKLAVEVRVFDNCNLESEANDTAVEPINVPYYFPTDSVYVNGLSYSKNFTDTVIKADDDLSITDDQEYVITNKDFIMWKNVIAKVSMKKKPHPVVHTFKVSAGYKKCTEAHTEEEYSIVCNLDLMSNSTQSIIATSEILKSKIGPIKDNSKISLTSEIELFLRPTDVVKNSSVTTKITFVKETSFANNRWLIGIIAGFIALLVLVVIIGILCRVGFFKRKQKQRLHVFRESLKVRNSRRNTHVSSVADGQGLDMDVVVDDPFDVPDAPHNDIIVMAEEKPQGP